jgi:hypothetical protein
MSDKTIDLRSDTATAISGHAAAMAEAEAVTMFTGRSDGQSLASARRGDFRPRGRLVRAVRLDGQSHLHMARISQGQEVICEAQDTSTTEMASMCVGRRLAAGDPATDGSYTGNRLRQRFARNVPPQSALSLWKARTTWPRYGLSDGAGERDCDRAHEPGSRSIWMVRGFQRCGLFE